MRLGLGAKNQVGRRLAFDFHRIALVRNADRTAAFDEQFHRALHALHHDGVGDGKNLSYVGEFLLAFALGGLLDAAAVVDGNGRDQNKRGDDDKN